MSEKKTPFLEERKKNTWHRITTHVRRGEKGKKA